jgi:hypothetical protein
MSDALYPAAHLVAAAVEAHFLGHADRARRRHQVIAHPPDQASIVAIIDAAFWASLRREEGYSPRISLAFLPVEQAGHALTFERPLPLDPHALTRLAPAVERPGIHLGVWRSDNGSLSVWGTTRDIPMLCFVLEVIAPGLLVIKHRRGTEDAKFVNVAVLEGDEVKILDERAAATPDCPSMLASLLGFDSAGAESINVLIELAVSIRAHRRGGSMLIVPTGSRAWLDSIVQPIYYSIAPPFTVLARVVHADAEARARPEWHDTFHRAVDAVAGLTAVDGATVVSDSYELLAFGAKIARRAASPRVEQVKVTEPIAGNAPALVHPSELGGTRHLSAAQFVHDQRNAVAYVASQDGRFTVFDWSGGEEIVHARRLEALLL